MTPRLTLLFLTALLTLALASVQAASAPPALAATRAGVALPCAPAAALAQTEVHRAGLVVTFGDRHSAMFCI